MYCICYVYDHEPRDLQMWCQDDRDAQGQQLTTTYISQQYQQRRLNYPIRGNQRHVSGQRVGLQNVTSPVLVMDCLVLSNDGVFAVEVSLLLQLVGCCAVACLFKLLLLLMSFPAFKIFLFVMFVSTFVYATRRNWNASLKQDNEKLQPQTYFVLSKDYSWYTKKGHYIYKLIICLFKLKSFKNNFEVTCFFNIINILS